MNTTLAPMAHYRTLVFDSARWSDIELRAGDIVVSTPPKSGTTWTQMLCALLVFDGPDFPAPLEQLSPWVDMLDRPIEEVRDTLAAQQHRRVIKTHTPLDGLPERDDIDYVVVGRDPRDIAVSFDHHMANLDMGRFIELRRQVVGPDDGQIAPPPPAPADPADRYRYFVDCDADPAVPTLANVLHHLEVAWQRRHRPNVHLLHYADLRRDLAAELLRLARELGFTMTPARAEQLAAEATIERMRDRADEVAPGASIGLWRDPRRFIRTGGSGEWRAFTGPADHEHYRQRVASLVGTDLARWVARGRRHPMNPHDPQPRPNTDNPSNNRPRRSSAMNNATLHKTRFAPTEIAPEVFLVHDHQGEGTEPVSVPLNTMVIRAAEPVVVDTGMMENRAQYLEDVFSLVEPEDIRWVFISHDDVDHTGNVNALMDAAPNATLVIDWFMQERMGASLDVPLHRWRWVQDGDTLDVGDRTLHVVRPPVFDSGTTRGLYDPATGVYWAADSFASPMAEPVRDVADLDPEPWLEGIQTFARYLSPWLTLVDDAKFQATVDRIEALRPTVLAGCHTPVIHRGRIQAALAATRSAPSATVPPQPDQAVLDAIQAVLEPVA